jgi:hypothetical protein
MRRVLEVLVFVGLTGVIGWTAWSGLQTGTADFFGTPVSRAAEPLAFWLALGLYATLALGIPVVAIQKARGKFEPIDPPPRPPVVREQYLRVKARRYLVLALAMGLTSLLGLMLCISTFDGHGNGVPAALALWALHLAVIVKTATLFRTEVPTKIVTVDEPQND